MWWAFHVRTGASPIGANVRKWGRTNGRREAVGVVPCADPACLSTRVGARHDRSEMLLLSWALPVRSRLWGPALSLRICTTTKSILGLVTIIDIDQFERH